MAAHSRALRTCLDAAFCTSLTAVTRDMRENGFVVIPEFLDQDAVVHLRQECQSLVESAEGCNWEGYEWNNSDNDHEWIVRRGCIFPTVHLDTGSSLPSGLHAFAAVRAEWPCTRKACQILFSAKMRKLVVALLGESACLFNDQYIVKPPHCGAASAFAWHCDRDWLPPDYREDTAYVSVWIALDDMTEESGTLLVRRMSRIYSTSHGHQPAAMPPEVIKVPAGSAVVMASNLAHCSLPNTGSHMRRAYMPQFSRKPMYDRDGIPFALAVPILDLID